MRQASPEQPSVAAYWAEPAAQLLAELDSGVGGLAAAEARQRLRRFGANVLQASRSGSAARLIGRQLGSPLVLILVFAAVVAAFVGAWPDATIVLAIVLGSALLGGIQEHRASAAVERLRDRVRVVVQAVRDGRATPTPSEEIVPGDVVLLSAGSLVPGDGVVLETKDFFVNQAVLTGESLPVEKHAAAAAAAAGLAERGNCVFMGTSVRSGTARVLIVRTGKSTAFGGIADRLRLRPAETEFERGVRGYGYFLTQVMLLLVIVVFAANVFLARPPVDSLLFAIALAVGMSPELLPAIISVTLSTGAREMARHGVIVRRLDAIENLGSMDVLCTDKTGTLTAGAIELHSALDAEGEPSHAVLRAACVNANLETGLANPLDEAIVARGQRDGIDLAGWQKVDELPYDFVRKRLSIVAADGGGAPVLVTKGAVPNVLEVCDRVQTARGVVALDAVERRRLDDRFVRWCGSGHRVLGVATKDLPRQPAYGRDDERALVFAGFLLFVDPPKPGAKAALDALAVLGIRVKIVTGDHRLVAAHLAEAVGLAHATILTGAELGALRDEALWSVAERTDIFAEVDPTQKERIVLALRRGRHVVGYLGDGINDAPALHAADVGISVDSAADVAKEAADFVLLETDLGVLLRGVEQGRKTFANTLKYISITTSANFGNMLSMAAASLFMPFLPLLAKQILLNNFLSDIPTMTLAGDAVDPEVVARPPRWDLHAVRRVTLVFGSISSLFDLVTFVVLLFAFRAGPELFRTGWFVESLLSELAIVFVLRTRGSIRRSRPGRWLWISSATVAAVTLLLPYSPLAPRLGFTPPGWGVLAAVLAITAAYAACSELAKRRFRRGA